MKILRSVNKKKAYLFWSFLLLSAWNRGMKAGTPAAILDTDLEDKKPRIEAGRARSQEIPKCHLSVPSCLPLDVSNLMSATGRGGFTLYTAGLHPNWRKAQFQVPLMQKSASPTQKQCWTQEHFCIYFSNLVCLRALETKSQNAKLWLKRRTVLLGYFQLVFRCSFCTEVLSEHPHRVACYF